MKNENINSLISYSQFVLTNGTEGVKQNILGLNIKHFHLEKKDFDGMILSESSFSNGDFKNCYFGAMYISNCVFEKINFTGSNFRKVEFYNSEFINCTFENSLFIGGSVLSSKFTQCEFLNCDFTDAFFSNNTSNDTRTVNCIQSESTNIDL